MEWLPTLKCNLPAPGVAHIWKLRLSATDQEFLEWHKLLSVEEQKCASDKCVRSRRQYIATRAQLREILSLYLGLPGQTFVLTANQHGKPRVADHQNPDNLQFNLTHSGNHALLAIACNANVGIDIESIRPKPYLKIAKRFFHEQEYQHLAAEDETQGLADFFRYWTIKEAVLKALGSGLQYGLDKIRLQEPECSAEVFRVCLQTEPRSCWEVHTFTPAENHVATIALQGSNWKLAFFQHG